MPSYGIGRACCRDRFAVGHVAVQAFERLKLAGGVAVRYVFHAGDKRPSHTLSLGSYATTNECLRQHGALQPGERIFHLDENRPDGHRSLSFYRGEPPYDVVRRAVHDVLRPT